MLQKFALNFNKLLIEEKYFLQNIYNDKINLF